MSNESLEQPSLKPGGEPDDHCAGMPAVSGHEPAPAQLSISETFSTVIAVSDGNFNAPQIRILQTNTNDFARLRLSVKNQAFWDIATVFDRMNFFAQLHGDVMTLRSNGNLSIAGTLTQGSSRTLKEQITELSSTEALETLVNLSPVKFKYKADPEKANQRAVAQGHPRRFDQ